MGRYTGRTTPTGAVSTEEADAGSLEEGLTELRAIIDHIDWATASATLQVLNGEYFVRADGLVNRRRDGAEELGALIHPFSEVGGPGTQKTPAPMVRGFP
ncbi:Imm7 family immunity protein [Streptomyces murinus]|uniref:Imm7 family immunity protein n=1 Tax=Streptomyces murinus TaxID=33900 RepID=UPI00372D3B96